MIPRRASASLKKAANSPAGIVHGDLIGVARVAKRHLAGDVNHVLAQRVVEVDSSRRALLNRLRPVAEGEPGGGGRQRQLARRAHARPGLDQDLQRVVVDGQRRNLRAVVILQVIPHPARPERRAAEITLIAHHVAGDAFHPGVGQGADQRFQRLVDVPAIQARIDGRVAAPINNQIALERARPVGLGCA